MTQRYNGKYIPNNKLALFRGVFSIDKTSFPFALRITLQPNIINTSSENPENGIDKNIIDNIQITLNLYKKSDSSLVSNFRFIL